MCRHLPSSSSSTTFVRSYIYMILVCKHNFLNFHSATITPIQLKETHALKNKLGRRSSNKNKKMYLGSKSLWKYMKTAVPLSNASWAPKKQTTTQHNNCHTSEHTYIPRSKAFLFISNWYKFKEIALDDSFRLSSIGVPPDIFMALAYRSNNRTSSNNVGHTFHNLHPHCHHQKSHYSYSVLYSPCCCVLSRTHRLTIANQWHNRLKVCPIYDPGPDVFLLKWRNCSISTPHLSLYYCPKRKNPQHWLKVFPVKHSKYFKYLQIYWQT